MYVPDMPEKADRTASSIARDAIVWGLGAVSFGLSGWSLTTLLMSVGTPLLFAVLGVGVFDLLALLAALQVYERRNEPHKGIGARVVMMLALLGSSVVNANHGLVMGGWPTAVVFGAAPLVFEIGFEIRHRSLTGLIWVLFFKEAKDALKRDAWIRIAPATEPPTGPGNTADAGTITVERADMPGDVPGAAGSALTAGTDVAHALGAGAGTDAGTMSALVSDPVMPALARPVSADPTTAPTADMPAQEQGERATAPEPLTVAGNPAPEVGTPVGKEMGKPSPARMPAPGKPLGKPEPVSMAQAVREVKSLGITDEDVIMAKVPALLGREVKEASLRREIRRQRPAAAPTTGVGAGPYL